MIWELEKSVYRAYQKVMKYAAVVLPFPTPLLLIGKGSVKNLADNIKVKGLKKVLIVTDKMLMKLKLLDSLLESLKNKGIDYVIYDDVQPNPTIDNIESGLEIYKDNSCDSLLAFGGGSPIDCAKVIGARVGNPLMSVRMMEGLFRVILPIPPFFCVPTTAGTGSETTVAAVISDPSTHQKFVINDLKLIPKIAVLDPELTEGLPANITAATGMDALTHAVEAYIGLNGNSFTDKKSEDAVALIFENLEDVYKDGTDLEKRTNMLIASFYAGAAFTQAYVGYVHAIAHTLGGLYGVPHGLANAIILPYILEFSFEEAKEKLAALAVAGKIAEPGESSDVAARRFIDKVKEMNKNMGIPTSIKEIQYEDIPLIAKRAVAEGNPAYPVPRIMTVAECEQIVEKLMA